MQQHETADPNPLDRLRAGALVAVRGAAGDGPAHPALVVRDRPDLRLRVARTEPARRGDEVVVTWGVDGRLSALRTRVLFSDPDAQELTVSRNGVIERPDERRGVDRFPLVAE